MKPKTMTPTPPDKDELNHIITKIRAGKDPDTGELHITDEEAKQAINHLIAKERLAELKRHSYGKGDVSAYSINKRIQELEQSLKEQRNTSGRSE